MKPLTALCAILLLPVAALGQSAPGPLAVDRIAQTGAGVFSNQAAAKIAMGPTAQDSAPSHLTVNVFHAAAVGAVVGGVIGALASRHQAAGVGFTHTPAVLFVITYGGLGALLGIIAGTFLPGG